MEIINEIKDVMEEIEKIENKLNSMTELDYGMIENYSKELFNLKVKLKKLENRAFLELEPKYESDEIDLYVKNYHVLLEEGTPDSITYLITIHKTKDIIGEIDIRYSLLASEKYLGNIGANINQEYRGKRYAKKAFTLLKDTMLQNELYKPIFTVRTNNSSSIKSLEAIGAKKIELVDTEDPYYIYEYDLTNEKNIR